jgi:hypothetical protein
VALVDARDVVDDRCVGGSSRRVVAGNLLTDLATFGEQGMINALVKVQEHKYASINSGKRRQNDVMVGSALFWIFLPAGRPINGTGWNQERNFCFDERSDAET